MATEIIPSPSVPVLPALIAIAGEKASWCFLEFFTVNIRNKNTRAAYGQAAGAFLRWCEDVQPVHMAGYTASDSCYCGGSSGSIAIVSRM